MQAFREEVGKIRRQHAIVVLTVDAIIVSGTLVRTLRQYVGGNPILLALTRCDLLPSYVRERTDSELREVLGKRAAVLRPAEVFLSSLPEECSTVDTIVMVTTA